MKRFALLSLLAVAACGGSSAPTGNTMPAGNEVILELGAVQQLPGTPISVKFEYVEDSRCPTNVTCIWEGNGRVGVVFSSSDVRIAAVDTVLNTHPNFPNAVNYRYVRVSLDALDPYPSEPAPTGVVYHARLRWEYLPD